MGHEAARAHRLHVLLVPPVAGGNPPCAFDHGDKPIIGMEMRLAEVAGLEAVEDDVKSGRIRIAMQHDLVDTGRAGWIAPFVLLRRDIGDGSRIEPSECPWLRIDPSAGTGSVSDNQQ